MGDKILLAESVEGESKKDVVDVDGGATLGNGIKVIGDNLGLFDKDIARVVYCQRVRGKGKGRVSTNAVSDMEGREHGLGV